MRKIFSEMLYKEMKSNKNIYLISADLGYGLWDSIKKDFEDRFINPGSAEQLMLGMAVGLVLDKKIAITYSITPFLLYRPFEIIRNYMNIEKIPVKLVGGGRNRDYKNAGYTHWAEEDRDVMKTLKNIAMYHPENEKELKDAFQEFVYSQKPSYLNLVK